jgi:hypothetical protein
MILNADFTTSSHWLYRPRPPRDPSSEWLRLHSERSQLADRHMGTINSDAVRRNSADRLSILDHYFTEPKGHPGIPSLHPLDSRRIGCSLQRHDYLLTRILVDEYRRSIRLIAWPDQRELFFFFFCVFDVLPL